MARAVGRVISFLVIAASWLLAGARLVLDLIGYSTVPEDIEVARNRYGQALLLLGVPWQGLLVFALITTLALMWVSWPRLQYANAPESKPTKDSKATRATQKALDDLFAEGARHMNRLIPTIENYDDAAERLILHKWQDRVLKIG